MMNTVVRTIGGEEERSDVIVVIVTLVRRSQSTQYSRFNTADLQYNKSKPTLAH